MKTSPRNLPCKSSYKDTHETGIVRSILYLKRAQKASLKMQTDSQQAQQCSDSLHVDCWLLFVCGYVHVLILVHI